ncbi:acyltransferase family protein, partial [Candidatus Arthromitus sp. SFB-turkey]|uniref:acyltransferase family protein n=1 Tax=Candidatus Arthromitus sp. SFB-turkey TaxID=1840217 RepID=UPI001FA6DAA2
MNNIKENKINLIEFNYLRAIGIFLVVLGHSFPYIDETNFQLYKYIHSLIYSFHMPLFIMISGFFAYKILTINSFKQYKLFISSKFKKLMIPYFTISFLT